MSKDIFQLKIDKLSCDELVNRVKERGLRDEQDPRIEITINHNGCRHSVWNTPREKDGGTRADFGPTHFDIGMSEDVYYSSKTSISVRVLDTAPLLNRIKSILGEGFCIIRESIPRLDEQFEITIPLTVADFPEKGHQAFQGYVKFRAELTSTANYFSLTRGIGQMPAPIPHELDANTVIQTYQAAYGFPMRTFSCIQGASVWVFLCPPGKSGVIPMGERREIFRTTVFLEKVPKPTIILSRDDDALMPDLETADQRVLPFTPLDVEVAVAQFIPELGLKFVGSKDTGGNTLEMMPKKKTIVCTGIHCRELMNVEAMGKNDPYVVLVLTNSGTREQTKVLDDHGSVADYEGLSMRFPLDNVPIEDAEFLVQVFDKNDYRSDVIIGEAKVKASDYIGLPVEFPIVNPTRANRCAGRVKLILHVDEPTKSKSGGAVSASQTNTWEFEAPVAHIDKMKFGDKFPTRGDVSVKRVIPNPHNVPEGSGGGGGGGGVGGVGMTPHDIARAEAEVQALTNSFTALQEDQTFVDCAEKSLLTLKYYFLVEIKTQNLGSAGSLLSQEEVAEVVRRLLAQLEAEGHCDDQNILSASEVLKRIISDRPSAQKWSPLELVEVQFGIGRILSIIRPLSFQIVGDRINGLSRASEILRGRDVIVLLGGARAGKTTLQQFLAGASFKEVTVGGLPHFVVIDEAALRLRQPKCESIASITHQGKEVLIYDTPSLNDTNGPEVDIANGIGMIKALQGCASVKVVVVMSNDITAERHGANITKVFSTLIKMVSNLPQHLTSISYIFTKFPFQNSVTISGVCQNALQELQPPHSFDPELIALYSDVIQKTKPQAKVVDRDILLGLRRGAGPSYFLDDIVDKPPIETPRTTFREFVAPASMQVMRAQITAQHNAIAADLERFNIPLVQFKLVELRTFSEVLPLRECEQGYKVAVKKVLDFVKKFSEAAFSRVERTVGSKAPSSDISSSFKDVAKLISMDAMVGEHGSHPLVSDHPLAAINIARVCRSFFSRLLTGLLTGLVRAIDDLQLSESFEPSSFRKGSPSVFKRLVSQGPSDQYRSSTSSLSSSSVTFDCLTAESEVDSPQSASSSPRTPKKADRVVVEEPLGTFSAKARRGVHIATAIAAAVDQIRSISSTVTETITGAGSDAILQDCTRARSDAAKLCDWVLDLVSARVDHNFKEKHFQHVVLDLALLQQLEAMCNDSTDDDKRRLSDDVKVQFLKEIEVEELWQESAVDIISLSAAQKISENLEILNNLKTLPEFEVNFSGSNIMASFERNVTRCKDLVATLIGSAFLEGKRVVSLTEMHKRKMIVACLRGCHDVAAKTSDNYDTFAAKINSCVLAEKETASAALAVIKATSPAEWALVLSKSNQEGEADVSPSKAVLEETLKQLALANILFSANEFYTVFGSIDALAETEKERWVPLLKLSPFIDFTSWRGAFLKTYGSIFFVKPAVDNLLDGIAAGIEGDASSERRQDIIRRRDDVGKELKEVLKLIMEKSVKKACDRIEVFFEDRRDQNPTPEQLRIYTEDSSTFVKMSNYIEFLDILTVVDELQDTRADTLEVVTECLGVHFDKIRDACLTTSFKKLTSAAVVDDKNKGMADFVVCMNYLTGVAHHLQSHPHFAPTQLIESFQEKIGDALTAVVSDTASPSDPYAHLSSLRFYSQLDAFIPHGGQDEGTAVEMGPGSGSGSGSRTVPSFSALAADFQETVIKRQEDIKHYIHTGEVARVKEMVDGLQNKASAIDDIQSTVKDLLTSVQARAENATLKMEENSQFTAILDDLSVLLELNTELPEAMVLTFDASIERLMDVLKAKVDAALKIIVESDSGRKLLSKEAEAGLAAVRCAFAPRWRHQPQKLNDFKTSSLEAANETSHQLELLLDEETKAVRDWAGRESDVGLDRVIPDLRAANPTRMLKILTDLGQFKLENGKFASLMSGNNYALWEQDIADFIYDKVRRSLDRAGGESSISIGDCEGFIKQVTDAADFIPRNIFTKFNGLVSDCSEKLNRRKKAFEATVNVSGSNVETLVQRIQANTQDQYVVEAVLNVLNTFFETSKKSILDLIASNPRDGWDEIFTRLLEHLQNYDVLVNGLTQCGLAENGIIATLNGSISQIISEATLTFRTNIISTFTSDLPSQQSFSFWFIRRFIALESSPEQPAKTLFQKMAQSDRASPQIGERQSLLDRAREIIQKALGEYKNTMNKARNLVHTAQALDRLMAGSGFDNNDKLLLKADKIKSYCQSFAIILTQFKESDRFFQAVAQAVAESSNAADRVEEYSYGGLRALVVDGVKRWGEFSTQSFKNTRTTTDSTDRNNFYFTLNACFSLVLQSRALLTHFSQEDAAHVSGLPEECKDHIKAQIGVFCTDALFRMNSVGNEGVDYQLIHINCDNLRAIKDNITDANVCAQADIGLGQAKDIFEQKIAVLKKLAWMSDTEWGLEDEKIAKLAEDLILMEIIGNGLPEYKAIVDNRMNSLLNEYERRPEGSNMIGFLGAKLNGDAKGRPEAQQIIAEQAVFRGYELKLRNDAFSTMKAPDILKKVWSDDFGAAQLRTPQPNSFEEPTSRGPISKEKLGAAYDALFGDGDGNGQYWAIVNQGIANREFISTIPGRAEGIAKGPLPQKKKLLALMAHVMAYWALHDLSLFDKAVVSEGEGSSGKLAYIKRPHAGQVFGILRLLGIDTDAGDNAALDTIMQNHFIQILTGEGKSVILAVTSTVMALFGYDIDCACYSKYLSTRDREAFADVFSAFGVSDQIQYGTFDKLCEKFLNGNGNIRDAVISLIDVDGRIVTAEDSAQDSSRSSTRPKLLLIDEVDVFFQKTFYGNLYPPVAKLANVATIDLVKHIWELSKDPSKPLTFRLVKETPQYAACLATFKSQWSYIVEEAVKEMLLDFKSYDDAADPYVVDGDRIGYSDNGQISTNVVKGYKTMFLYLKERDAGNITQESLDQNIFIKVNCGAFSYAETPKLYNKIIGVTGTLDTLSQGERRILRDDYNVHKATFIPSAYGDSKVFFNTTTDVKVCEPNEHYNKIVDEINKRLVPTSSGGGNRAVIVFFQSTTELDKFKASSYFDSLRARAQVLREDMDDIERSNFIRRAVSENMVTLSIREYGRGTDFVCTSKQMNSRGGVHIIQTFFSNDMSEEKQIRGRTGRQGNEGSFSLIVSQTDLSDNFDCKVEDFDTRGDKYTCMCEKRAEMQAKADPDLVQRITEISGYHQESMTFLAALQRHDGATITDFLRDKNLSAYVDPTITPACGASRTVVLLDATGSMGDVLTATKNTVAKMFEEAKQTLQEENVTAGFEVQIAVFRNYNSRANERGNEKILDFSEWATDPQVINDFLDSVRPGGGWGNEAVEVGFWFVNDQMATASPSGAPFRITQVLLIGDAKPNLKGEVGSKRSDTKYGFGEQYWATTPLKNGKVLPRGTECYYEPELAKMRESGVKVRTFFVKTSNINKSDEDDKVKKFNEIDSENKCEVLEFSTRDKANASTTKLKEIVTMEILSNVGEQSGDPEQAKRLRNAYRNKFAGRT